MAIMYKLRFSNSLYKLQIVQDDLYKLQYMQILDLYNLQTCTS